MTHRRRFIIGTLALPVVAGCRARVGTHTALSPMPETLRVMTLNLAHGRGRALTQSAARQRDWYRRNLDAIATVLTRERPAVVALQEAELGSKWAGSFDHVRYLAQRSALPHVHATPHMNEPPRFLYGTALIARHPLDDTSGGTFATGGRWHKGWTEAVIETARGRVRLVSVHLDFASVQRRTVQADELAQALRNSREPLVMMGDFNSTWFRSDRSAVNLLARSLGLQAFAPDDNQPATFGRRRIDWIMVSPPMTIVQRYVLARDTLSDHRAVIADIDLTGRNHMAAHARRG